MGRLAGQAPDHSGAERAPALGPLSGPPPRFAALRVLSGRRTAFGSRRANLTGSREGWCGADATLGCLLAPLRDRVPAGTVSEAMSEQHETAREFSAVPVVVVVFAIGARGCRWNLARALGSHRRDRRFRAARDRGADRMVRRRERLGDAPQVTPIEDGRYRILVVADERCAAASFAEELRSHAGGRPLSIFIMAPALESRVGRLAGDQKGYEDATRRLNEIVEGLKRADTEAQGEVGPSDPLQAADDGLRQFAANETCLSHTRRVRGTGSRGGWSRQPSPATSNRSSTSWSPAGEPGRDRPART